VIDVFFRRYNRSLERTLSAGNVVVVQLDLPADTGLPDILAAAYRAGASKGSSRSGIFEVQTDIGIWSREDGGKIDPPTRARFSSWSALDGAE